MKEGLGEHVAGLFAYFNANLQPYYISRPMPCEFDEKISGLVKLFIDSLPEGRKLIIDSVPADDAAILTAFAERMASLGVRENSRRRLLEGLIALVMEDYKGDWRENVMRLAPLYHSATKINVNPETLFSEAASFGNGEAAEIIAAFPSRDPKDRSLEAMWYREANNQEGFIYEQGPPIVKAREKSYKEVSIGVERLENKPWWKFW